MPVVMTGIFYEDSRGKGYNKDMNIFDQIIQAINDFLQTIVSLITGLLQAIVDFFERLFSIFG